MTVFSVAKKDTISGDIYSTNRGHVHVKATKGSLIIETYAFLDFGSFATFCTEMLMEQLSVRGRKTESCADLQCDWTGSMQSGWW